MKSLYYKRFAGLNGFYKIQKIFQFMGKKAIFVFFLGIFSSILLSFIEFLFALAIQFLLISFGFISNNVTIFGYSFPKLTILTVLVLLFFIGFLRFISQLINSQSLTYITEYSNCRIKHLAIYDLLFQSSSKKISSSNVNFMISELAPKLSIFMSSSLSLVSTLIQCSLLLIFLIAIAWKEAIVCLLGILVIGFIISKNNKKIRSLSKKIPSEQEEINKGIEKVSRNILFIKIMKTNNQEYIRLIKNSLNYSLNYIRVCFLNNFNSIGTPFLGIILLVVTIFISQEFWHTKSIVLISFLYMLVRFIQNLSVITNSFGMLNISYPQFKKSVQYFNEFSDRDKMLSSLPITHIKFKGSTLTPDINLVDNQKIHKQVMSAVLKNAPEINFDAVSFYYDTNEKKILENFSMILKSGEQLGIIGSSGSGKTTLLMLLLGILEPQHGNIWVDGKSPKDYFFNNNIKLGYVGPEPFLIEGSIKENLLYGLDSIPDEDKIWSTLELVSLKKDFLSKTLNYRVSENHSELSAGQKQRLCIARAILNNPQILILDEPTSNLDESTENEVCESISKLKKQCTTIIVSHRTGALKNIDKIIEVSSK
ncbi:ABC transporter ATP-binding protein [Pigmentibacter sp. JX0631]|uniref:ABC transporter ATP-binding protein n=1 Tax=Pigmentibacter sp. JX0631 TaxID=2976982 RepID=UPI00246939E0|nr:ABC transporter ATP-binding protein [Pigmentibacter sp. JX0631]WGL60828.1 ABC transporter ATP-binding protein [Pigmentibacter sp. JX0631]